jgi:tetratricopeptide (TPR) repeat protein
MIVAGIRAAARGPRDAFAFNALGISVGGFASELSLAAIQEAIRIDPLYLYPPLNAAELLVYLGRADEALERVDGVLRIEPGMPLALARKALVLIDMGRARDAAALVGPLNQLVSEGRVEPVIVSMIEDGVTLGQGAPEDKRRALDRLVRVNLDAGFYNEYPPVYLWLITHGRVDDTLATLEARARASRVPYDFLRLRPEFAAVAGDPRFQRILDLSRGHFESLLAALERARGRGEFPPFLERPLADLRRKLGLRPNAAGVTPAS